MTEKLHPRTEDLTGRRFGQIVVLEFNGYDSTDRHSKIAEWKCRCDCGKEWNLLASGLLEKRRPTKSCRGCCYKGHTTRAVERAKNKSSDHVGYWYLLRVRNNAKDRGLVYAISMQDAEDQWIKQKGRCSLTDLELTPTSNYTADTAAPNGNISSLDRVDSCKTIGYIPGNIEWVHKHVNVWKLDHSREYYVELSTLVADKARRDKRGWAGA